MASQPVLDALGHAASGAAGTAISTAAGYPLDLVTTRLKAQRQLTIDKDERYDGVRDAIRDIVEHEGGISALYRGVGADVAKSVVDSFLFFGFYTYLRPRSRKPRVLEELALGALAGACSRACTTPVSNVVARKQVSASGESSVLETLGAMRREGGLLGLWSGYSATLVLTLNPSITFFINRRLASRVIPALEEEDVPVAWAAFLLAAVSKATATAITYPFQTAKTHMQMAGKAEATKETAEKLPTAETGSQSKANGNRLVQIWRTTIFGVLVRIIRQNGVRALYDGIQGELLKSFFSHGLTMVSKGILHRLIIRLWLLSAKHKPMARLQSK